MEEEFKNVFVLGLKDDVKVEKTGQKVFYKDKLVHQSLVKAKNHKHGYYQISVGGKRIYVHRLVAEAFVRNPKPISYKFVIHINGDSTDNTYSNLQWGDKAMVSDNRKVVYGESFRGHSTISYDDALLIAKRLDNGEFAKDICQEYGVSEMSIARIRKRYCTQKTKSIRYPKEIKSNVLRLCEKHDPAHVAKITNIPYHTVWRWVKKAEK